MASVELRGVSKVYRDRHGEPVLALDNVNLQVGDGEMVAIVGPSGCGKTTLLRLVAGLDTPTEGDVLLGGTAAGKKSAADRDVAMVFQRDALFPHMNVLDNISLGLRLRRVGTAESEKRISHAVELMQLKRHLGRFPGELSGGERQRVAFARALVRRPKAFLLDEPLASLDPQSRTQLRFHIAQLQRELGATILYVTHDQAEALALGRRVVVMRSGAVQQVAPASEVVSTPANAFVAGFVGAPALNVIRGRVEDGKDGAWFVENNVGGSVDGMQLRVPLDAARGARLAAFADGNVLLAVSAEDVALNATPLPGAQATVEMVEPRGSDVLVHLSTGATRLIAKANAPTVVPGEMVGVSVNTSGARFFNPASEKPIRC